MLKRSGVNSELRQNEQTRLSRINFLYFSFLAWVILSGCGYRMSPETQLPVRTPGKVELMGFIKQLGENAGSVYVSFDQAEWFDGTEAGQAMQEDGLCVDSEPDCQPANPFYIRNQKDETSIFQVSERVVIVMQTLSHRPDGTFNSDEKIDLDRFQKAYNSESTAHLRLVPYWITVENGIVITISEQYVP